jgi:hypothetical protein
MSREDFEGIRDHAKRTHTERVSKNPDRIRFALYMLKSADVEHVLKNEQTGHIHAWDKSGQLQQFWAGTGTIFGREFRGIHNFIKLCTREVRNEKRNNTQVSQDNRQELQQDNNCPWDDN